MGLGGSRPEEVLIRSFVRTGCVVREEVGKVIS